MLKKEQYKNQNNFNKVYEENKVNDIFNDPFFNNSIFDNSQLNKNQKKDW
jgi:hypothetical protein